MADYGNFMKDLVPAGGKLPFPPSKLVGLRYDRPSGMWLSAVLSGILLVSVMLIPMFFLPALLKFIESMELSEDTVDLIHKIMGISWLALFAGMAYYLFFVNIRKEFARFYGSYFRRMTDRVRQYKGGPLYVVVIFRHRSNSPVRRILESGSYGYGKGDRARNIGITVWVGQGRMARLAGALNVEQSYTASWGWWNVTMALEALENELSEHDMKIDGAYVVLMTGRHPDEQIKKIRHVSMAALGLTDGVIRILDNFHESIMGEELF